VGTGWQQGCTARPGRLPRLTAGAVDAQEAAATARLHLHRMRSWPGRSPPRRGCSAAPGTTPGPPPPAAALWGHRAPPPGRWCWPRGRRRRQRRMRALSLALRLRLLDPWPPRPRWSGGGAPSDGWPWSALQPRSHTRLDNQRPCKPSGKPPTIACQLRHSPGDQRTSTRRACAARMPVPSPRRQ